MGSQTLLCALFLTIALCVEKNERNVPKKRWCFCECLKVKRSTYKNESKDLNVIPITVATPLELGNAGVALPDKVKTCLKLILSFNLLTPKELLELHFSCKTMKALIYNHCDFFTICASPTMHNKSPASMMNSHELKDYEDYDLFVVSVRQMENSKNAEFLFNGLFFFPAFGAKNIQYKYFIQHNVCALTLQNDWFKAVQCFHKSKFIGLAPFSDLRKQSLEYFHSFFTQGMNIYFVQFTSGGLRIFFPEQNRSFDFEYVHKVIREEGNNILCYSFRRYKFCTIQSIVFEDGAMNVYFKYVCPIFCTIEGNEKILIINDKHTQQNINAALSMFLSVESSKWKDVPGTRLELSVKLQDMVPKYSQIFDY